ncbi:hypothetical protein [Mesorhizobium sp.]|uniref:hypothetical protein n=1 Tax=Mesorhizobium sp. TaxID=1871066 RepID=UPI000FE5B810|nr:hypothetical protein [Mesorhizobium sp.]RWI72149.1 MAG: hypothetical protein EOR19_23550 [Mesorhizobium sp.]
MSTNKILALDALTCALMGIVLMLSATTLAPLLSLPRDLLFYAGCLLVPIAIFMAVLARQSQPWGTGVWLVILGNAAWVLASLAALILTGPNTLGVGFLLAQALVVAVLALAEFKAVGRPAAGVA